MKGFVALKVPPTTAKSFIIASARQSVARFKHVDFERCPCPAKGNSGREIQAGLEYRYLEARRHNDVLAAAGIKLGGIVGTDWVCKRRRLSGDRCHRGENAC